MKNNSGLSSIQVAQQLVTYQQEMESLKKEQEDLLAQVRAELEEKKRKQLLTQIAND